MQTFTVKLQASKAGSIGTKYCEHRVYTVEAIDAYEAQCVARERAYAEGLEHTLITSVRGG